MLIEKIGLGWQNIKIDRFPLRCMLFQRITLFLDGFPPILLVFLSLYNQVCPHTVRKRPSRHHLRFAFDNIQ